MGNTTSNTTTLPTDSEERKGVPLYSGVLRYFPAALAGVAMVSKWGNDKHNPGEAMHHAREKSVDEADCLVRHLIDLAENGGYDEHSIPQVAYIAWRALALAQKWYEEHEGAPLAPAAKVPERRESLREFTTRGYGAALIETYDQAVARWQGRDPVIEEPPTIERRLYKDGKHVASAGPDDKSWDYFADGVQTKSVLGHDGIRRQGTEEYRVCEAVEDEEPKIRYEAETDGWGRTRFVDDREPTVPYQTEAESDEEDGTYGF